MPNVSIVSRPVLRKATNLMLFDFTANSHTKPVDNRAWIRLMANGFRSVPFCVSAVGFQFDSIPHQPQVLNAIFNGPMMSNDDFGSSQLFSRSCVRRADEYQSSWRLKIHELFSCQRTPNDDKKGSCRKQQRDRWPRQAGFPARKPM